MLTIRSAKRETAKTQRFCKFQLTPSTDLSTHTVENPKRDELTNPAIVRVALDTPLRRLFDYLPAKSPAPAPRPGARVRVPFGRQRLVGVVHSIAPRSDLPREKLKPILEVLDGEPVIDARVLELLEFAAQYYHHPIGEVMAAALPKLARSGAPSQALTEHWRATPEGRAALEAGALGRAHRQRALLEALGADGLTADALGEKFEDWRVAMRALAARGLACSAELPDQSPGAAVEGELLRGSGPALSPEQSAAVAAIDAGHATFAPFLLHGITGSGKTEVYL